MNALRAIVFALLFTAATVPIFAGTAIAELARPGAIFAWRRGWGAVFMWLARHVLGIRLVVLGAPPRAGIVAGKHQSLYETLALMTLIPDPAVVLKRELLAIPLWRFFARRAAALPVDREASAAAMRALLRGAMLARAQGRPILIFPEGERVMAGAAPPLKPGVMGLYARLGLPVTPLALDTARVWPKRGWPRPGVTRFAFGEPIPPGLPRAVFEARLHAAINAAPA